MANNNPKRCKRRRKRVECLANNYITGGFNVPLPSTANMNSNGLDAFGNNRFYSRERERKRVRARELCAQQPTLRSSICGVCLYVQLCSSLAKDKMNEKKTQAKK